MPLLTSLKSLRKGAECPSLGKGQLRLYNMRFCPYAQRARLVLSYYDIPYETVNINLRDKPDWFWQKNPDGTVPVLESDGKLILESAICAEYLDEVYGKCRLISTDPYKKALQKMLLQKFNKFTGIYYGIMKSKSKEEYKDVKENILEALKPFENELHGKYFGGDLPNLVDLLIWPWFERFPVLLKLYDVDVFKCGEHLPKLQAWVEDMGKLAAVKACRTADDLHVEFIRQYFDPNLAIPDYDLGLDT